MDDIDFKFNNIFKLSVELWKMFVELEKLLTSLYSLQYTIYKINFSQALAPVIMYR